MDSDSDLRLLRDLGDGLQPPTQQPPPNLRWRVLEGISTPAPKAARRPWVVAAALAASLAVPILVVQLQTGPQSPPIASSAPADTTRLLDLAADLAATRQQPSPRPDQFVYTESIVVYLIGDEPMLVRLWRSVDGSRLGLMQVRALHAPESAWQVVMAGTAPAGALPADPEGVHRYLYRQENDEYATTSMDADERALSRAADALRVTPHAPAVFEAMARIPGVSVRHGVADVAGRLGVAVAYTGRDGSETELVFEPGSYRYLGVNRKLVWLELPRDGSLRWSLQTAAREAVMSVSVVDEAGQVPQ